MVPPVFVCVSVSKIFSWVKKEEMEEMWNIQLHRG